MGYKVTLGIYGRRGRVPPGAVKLTAMEVRRGGREEGLAGGWFLQN